MNTDCLQDYYPLSRQLTLAKNGMVATSSYLAAKAGYDILRKGGNAIDAAVATAAALTVVEPTSNGIGSDAFAIGWFNGKLFGVNGSGYSPRNISIDKLKQRGYDKMPQHGFLSVTVPGAVKTWASLINRYGRLTLEEVLEPAINFAKEGYIVSPVTGYSWQRYYDSMKDVFADKPEYRYWFEVFTKNGQPYKAGDLFKSDKMADGLIEIAKTNGESLYSGKIAQQFIRQSGECNGYFTLEDLNEYDVEYVDPLSMNYRGYDILELPPNGHGIVTLMALNTLKNFSFDKRDSLDTVHHQFEAMKMAFADGFEFISDPRYCKDFKEYLSDAYGKKQADRINDVPSNIIPENVADSGTVYLCTADEDGNMVSFIQSNYRSFGSGIVLDKYGIALQNRGSDFSLNENHVNCLKGHKKTYHTIIPGFLMKDNKPVGPFGVMGGYMQPQGHLQVIMNMLDFNLNPQQALNAPRWQWTKDNKFIVEPLFDKKLVDQLRGIGHDVSIALNHNSFGRGQIILRDERGFYIGGCESRCDSGLYGY